MKTKATYLLTLLTTATIFGQRNAPISYEPPLGSIYTRTIEINEKALAFGLSEEQFNLIKDHAYANPGFVPGIIYQDNKPIKADVPMRYNAYADEIEIKQHKTSADYGALVKDPNIFVKTGTQFYVFVPYEDSNEKGGYFNVLKEGDRYQLYKKITATYKEGVPSKSSYSKATPPSFAKTTTYYLVDNGTFLQLPNGKSNLQRAFTDIDGRMSNYIKENKIDLTNEMQLSRAVEYLDKLK